MAMDLQDRDSLLHRGSLPLCVLALLDREPQHAYGIVQRLGEHGFDGVSYGTVYPLVTRLRAQGLVDQRAAVGVGGPARNVLSLTSAGRTALTAWTRSWREHGVRVESVLTARSSDKETRDVG